MRIDPSQLSEPLSHVLRTGAADAAGGQQATEAARLPITDPQLETLDKLLLRRLQLQQVFNAADSIGSIDDARARTAQVREQASDSPGQAHAAHGTLDARRVRGLLG